MSVEPKLQRPWLVAVWPGMGNVALSAGYYLMAKLEMRLLAEFSAQEMFEMEYVEVNAGLIHPGLLPRSRLFSWSDPEGQHDVVVFIGEAQPQVGKSVFCHRLVDLAQQIGVERVFTFAAMATDMRPEQFSRVFGASTDPQGLEQLKSLEIEVIEEGRIGGLNGILLGVAAERGLNGTCLLGEMPHIFAQFPFPKAALAILRVFSSIGGIDLDTHELVEQTRIMDRNLGHLLTQVENAMQQKRPDDEEGETENDEHEEFQAESTRDDEPGLSAHDVEHIENLFREVEQDRSKAYELKRELDRLDAFKDYEDRFLNLFRKEKPE